MGCTITRYLSAVNGYMAVNVNGYMAVNGCVVKCREAWIKVVPLDIWKPLLER